MSLDILKREFENVIPVFFNLYDQHEADREESLRLLASIDDNRQKRQNPVKLDYLMNFPEATSWQDDVVFHFTLDQLEWTVPLEGHQVVAPVNRLDVGRPNTVVQLEKVIATMPAALARAEIATIAEVFHQNPMSVTGKTFFATDHPRARFSPFSNLLAPEFGSLDGPALQILAELINEVITHFSTIGAVQSVYTDDAKVRGNLLVIVHNDKYQTLFRELQVSTVLPGLNLADGTIVGERQNPVRESFRLWRDHKSPAGQENYIEFVMLTQDGPKPAVYVVDTDPEPIVLTENRVKSGFYGVGFQKIFGVRPFIPNTTIQVQPVLAVAPLAGPMVTGAPRLDLAKSLRRRAKIADHPERIVVDAQFAKLVEEVARRLNQEMMEEILDRKKEQDDPAPKPEEVEDPTPKPEDFVKQAVEDPASLLARLPTLDRQALTNLHVQLLSKKPHGNVSDSRLRESVRLALEELTEGE